MMQNTLRVEDCRDVYSTNARRRAQIEGEHWRQTRTLQDAAYREFMALDPEGTPADFLEWLENSVEWLVHVSPGEAPQRLAVFGDRTAYRIFQRNRVAD